MLESDADRLAMIKSLGGQLVRTRGALTFWAIFDNASNEAYYDDATIESTGPELTARTSDVGELTKGDTLTIGTDEYRIVKHEPDGTGISRVILRL